jgi:uncharacterized membrane protein YgdD (TMEM256/DUF423 family)
MSVILGAFGAHALEDLLSAESLKSYETGVRYMMLHSVVILFLNGALNLETKTTNTLSYLFFAGIFLFSGSIFAISTGLVGASAIWFITPLGGFLLILGWIGMAIAFLRDTKVNRQKK